MAAIFQKLQGTQLHFAERICFLPCLGHGELQGQIFCLARLFQMWNCCSWGLHCWHFPSDYAFYFALPLDKWLLEANQNLSQVPLRLRLQFVRATQLLSGILIAFPFFIPEFRNSSTSGPCQLWDSIWSTISAQCQLHKNKRAILRSQFQFPITKWSLGNRPLVNCKLKCVLQFVICESSQLVALQDSNLMTCNQYWGLDIIWHDMSCLGFVDPTSSSFQPFGWSFPFSGPLMEPGLVHASVGALALGCLRESSNNSWEFRAKKDCYRLLDKNVFDRCGHLQNYIIWRL